MPQPIKIKCSSGTMVYYKFILKYLLLIGGVETNPGPKCGVPPLGDYKQIGAHNSRVNDNHQQTPRSPQQSHHIHKQTQLLQQILQSLQDVQIKQGAQQTLIQTLSQAQQEMQQSQQEHFQKLSKIQKEMLRLQKFHFHEFTRTRQEINQLQQHNFQEFGQIKLEITRLEQHHFQQLLQAQQEMYQLYQQHFQQLAQTQQERNQLQQHHFQELAHAQQEIKQLQQFQKSYLLNLSLDISKISMSQKIHHQHSQYQFERTTHKQKEIIQHLQRQQQTSRESTRIQDTMQQTQLLYLQTFSHTQQCVEQSQQQNVKYLLDINKLQLSPGQTCTQQQKESSQRIKWKDCENQTLLEEITEHEVCKMEPKGMLQTSRFSRTARPMKQEKRRRSRAKKNKNISGLHTAVARYTGKDNDTIWSEIVQLLEVKVDPDSEINKQLLDIKSEACPLYRASERGHLELLELLLEHGLGVDKVVFEDGSTLLHAAARYNHAPVVKLLVEHGATIKKTDQDGWTALHWSIYWGHLPVSRLLVEAGLDPFTYPPPDMVTQLRERARCPAKPLWFEVTSLDLIRRERQIWRPD
uniref:Uncharacterized protein n=1 Tax=Timema genevievae TaxID=629358 RepID=A0A7R9PMX7_TIMGE|nr:unnamed protein product [Timema genevievae]